MAKASLDNDLFKRLRASGLRKRAARAIAEAGDNSSKLVRGTVDELRGLADQIESKARGGAQLEVALRGGEEGRRDAQAHRGQAQHRGAQGGRHAREVRNRQLEQLALDVVAFVVVPLHLVAFVGPQARVGFVVVPLHLVAFDGPQAFVGSRRPAPLVAFDGRQAFAGFVAIDRHAAGRPAPLQQLAQLEELSRPLAVPAAQPPARPPSNFAVLSAASL